jgi:hypothetical protein
LPIAFEFIDPKSALAQKRWHLEALWNQRWNLGGYGRYHVTSEPDSPAVAICNHLYRARLS